MKDLYLDFLYLLDQFYVLYWSRFLCFLFGHQPICRDEKVYKGHRRLFPDICFRCYQTEDEVDLYSTLKERIKG